MENVELLTDLAIALGAALLGGFAAHLLRQPVIIGYLIAGILIGPHTPGPVTSVERVQTLANLGVALLMFALGTEFSIEALQRVRKVAVLGGTIQIVLVIVLGTLLGLFLGFSLTNSIFLGGVLSISSSIVILKLLLPKGEVESIVGRVALGTGIVQDMATIAMIIILPALSAGIGVELLTSAGVAIFQGGLFLAVAYLLGTRLLPPLLEIVARFGSRELFLLTVIAIAFGMSVLGHLVGISFALGAFIGGLVVSESEFSSHVLDEIIPLRDIFSSLFFVSIGMLVEPSFLLANAFSISLLVVAIIVGKFVIISGVVKMFGYDARNAMRIGLLMAQIGEFSFVLASVGLVRSAIEPDLYSLILAAALVTLLLNPILVNNARYLIMPFRQILEPLMSGASGSGQDSSLAEPGYRQTAESNAARLSTLKGHVIICGFGRVGQEVSRALSNRGFPFAVMDYSPARAEAAREMGYLAIQADATNPAALAAARITTAKLLVVALPDLFSAEQVILAANATHRKIEILTRTNDARAIPHLKAAGANEVIQPEFEAGLEMVRQTLRKFGVSSLETQALTAHRRQQHYK